MSPAGRQVHFKSDEKAAAEHPSEKVGEEIRKLYSWNRRRQTDQQLSKKGTARFPFLRYLNSARNLEGS